tara:strand:- start:1229 stop:2236 length:1008 start_codon:yes stop_codon:yes gene_type:complete
MANDSNVELVNATEWTTAQNDEDHDITLWSGSGDDAYPISASLQYVKSIRLPGLPTGSNFADDVFENYENWRGTQEQIDSASMSPAFIKGVFKSSFDVYYSMFLENGKEIKFSWDHPTFIKRDGEYRFVLAQDITTSDQVMDINKNLIDVTSMSFQSESINMVELNVEEKDVYFVEDILFHNAFKCFMPDQLISMADGELKEIQYVDVGEMILAWDENSNSVKESEVCEIQTKMHDDVYEMTLANGKKLKPTGNHPFLIFGKGWCTIDKYELNHGGGTGVINVGDEVYDVSSGVPERVKVTKLEPIEGAFTTYNFIDTEYKTIIADGIITHNTGK